MTVTHKKYPNDFRIVYERSLNALPLTTLYIFCDVGSVHEDDMLRGASHFIEHMCFKGTSKISASKIINEYSKIGAYFNAYTSKRYTCYTIKCQDQYIHHSLEILTDMLMHSKFKEEEYHREHKVVVEENNNNDNNPDIILQDTINQLLYKGSSYEQPVDSLKYHTKDRLHYRDVIDFYHKYYHPSRMLMSVVSNTPLKEIEKIVRKMPFMKIKKPTHFVEPVIRHGIMKYREPQIQLIEKRGVTNAHIMIGFRICGCRSEDYYPLILLSKVMGSGLNGRLMLLLRERRGLVYGASASVECYEYTGDFTFSTKARVENLLHNGERGLGVLPLLVKLINEMITDGITKEELYTTKGNIQGKMILDLQNIVTQTEYNAESIIYGRLGDSDKIVPYKDIYETFVKNITMDDIKRVIKRYFNKENMCVCILSEKLPSLETIKRECVKIVS
jgi:predicted Zn-dependent peptidase